MPNQCVHFCLTFCFEFFHKFFSARKSNLVDILFNLFASHTNAFILNGDRLFLFINRNLNGNIAQLIFVFTKRGKGFKLLRCIYCIRNQFTQKYFMIRIKKFFNNRKNVFSLNIDLTFFHLYRFIFKLIKLKIVLCITQTLCHQNINDKMSET